MEREIIGLYQDEHGGVQLLLDNGDTLTGLMSMESPSAAQDEFNFGNKAIIKDKPDEIRQLLCMFAIGNPVFVSDYKPKGDKTCASRITTWNDWKNTAS